MADVKVTVRVDREGTGIQDTERQIGKLRASSDKLGASISQSSSLSANLARRMGDVSVSLSNSANKAQNFSQVISGASGEAAALKSSFAGLPALIAGAFSIGAVTSFAKAVADSAIQFDKTINTLEFATGSAKAAGEAYGFVSQQAERLGLRVQGLAGDFAKFSAATKNTQITAEETKEIFVGVTEAARALGLGTEDTGRIFRAFTQIISKGKVTAEEFRGQIGDALPVATTVAAKALGVTTKEFSRLLDAGELTLDLIPKLGRAFSAEFGETATRAAGSLSAEIDRLDNAWTRLKVTFADSGGTDVAIGFMDLLRRSITNVSDSIDALQNARLRTGANLAQQYRDLIRDLGGSRSDAVPGARSAVPLPIAPSPILLGQQRNAEESLKKRQKAVEDLSKSTDAFTRSLENNIRAENIRTEALRIGGNAGKEFEIVQKLRAEADQKGIVITDALGASIQRLAEAEVANLPAIAGITSARKEGNAAKQEAEKLAREEKARIDELRAALDAEQAARDSVRTSVARQTAALLLEAEALTLGGEAGKRFAIVQGEIIKAQEAGVKITRELTGSFERLADAQISLDRQADAIRAAEDAAQEAAREFERTAQVIEQSLTDALLRGFENGKGFAENFKDTLVNIFKTLVLRPVIEFIINPIAGAISGVIQTALGGIAQAAFGTLLGGVFSPAAAAAGGGIAGTGAAGAGSAAGGDLLGNTLQTGLGTIIGQNSLIQAGINNLGFKLGLTGGPSGQAGLLGSGSASNLLGTIGGAAGIATLSFGLGSFLGSKTGSALEGAAAGAGAGAASGAALGTFVFPGIGTAIGALIGALFGGVGGGLGFSTPPRGFATFDASGVLRSGGKKGFDAAKELVPLGEQINKSINAIDKDLGLGLIKNRIKFWIGFKAGRGFRTSVSGRGEVDFEDPRKLQAVILREEIRDALPDQGKGLTEFQKIVLERGLAKDTIQEQLKEIDKLVSIKKELDAFISSGPGSEVVKQIRELQREFDRLIKSAQNLGLEKEIKRAEKEFERRKSAFGRGALAEAFQLAGREPPQEDALKDLKDQFREFRKIFKALGLDTKILSQLFREASERVAAAREQAKRAAIAQAFSFAGRQPPLALQQAEIIAQFAELERVFANLGLSTGILKELFGDAIADLHRARQQAGRDVIAQAFQLAGRQVPIAIQQANLIAQFNALGDAFKELGLDTGILQALFNQALAALSSSIDQQRRDVISSSFQLAGLLVPLSIQQASIIAQFAALHTAFADLGLDTSNLAGLLQSALGNLQQSFAQQGRDAIAQAFQLAGQEVPIAIQQANLIAQFAALGEAFLQLGLDSSILSGLLNTALENLQQAQDGAGGFIGFLSPTGEITSTRPTEVIPLAGGARNRLVSKPTLFLVGEAGPETISVGRGGSGNGSGGITIALNGPAIFDEVSTAKFVRAVDRKIAQRRVRF